MRGLKPLVRALWTAFIWSHLLQMRGLKLVTMYAKVNNIESHLLQMRGLKLKLVSLLVLVIGRIFYRCVD